MDKLKVKNSDVTGISVSEKMSVITVTSKGQNSEIIQKIFQQLHNSNVNIDIIIKQELHEGTWGISFSCDKSDVDKAISVLNTFKSVAELNISNSMDLIAVTIFGVGMVTSPGIANRAFTALLKELIEIYNVTTSETSITMTVESSDKMKVIIALCEEFDL